MENIPDTPEGIILESLLEGMNQYYSAELSQKVKRGMYEIRRKGNFQGGILPYGYKSEGRKIVVDPERAEAVLFMYEQFSMGVCARVIINELTARGVLCKGKPFTWNTVYGILKKEAVRSIMQKMLKSGQKQDASAHRYLCFDAVHSVRYQSFSLNRLPCVFIQQYWQKCCRSAPDYHSTSGKTYGFRRRVEG